MQAAISNYVELMKSPFISGHRKPRWLIMASNVGHNLQTRLRMRYGHLQWEGGATHLHLPLEKSLDYIQRVYQDYLHYSSLRPGWLVGKRVLEIGPGDNLGVALRFIADGARQVICVDKFFAKRDEQQQLRIYRALREQIRGAERERFDSAVQLGSPVSFNEQRLRYVHGVPAERANELLEPTSFDLIVSRAVLYEVRETDQAFKAMDQLLVPGGIMIHKIACLDWMFPQNNYHPLEYLTVPEHVYRLMTDDSGKSNRRMMNYYRDKMDQLGYSATFHITRTLDSGKNDFPPGAICLQEGIHYTQDSLNLVRQIRPRLQPQFRSLSDEDLLIQDMFLVAIKPDHGPAIGSR